MRKRVLSLILTITLLLSVLPVVPAQAAQNDKPFPFKDVAKDKWYFDDVNFVFQNELMNGISDSAFSPAATVTRAQAVTVLWRIAGCPSETDIIPFKDVLVGSWYYDAVKWAVKRNITRGVASRIFAPNSWLTREQFVTLLLRFAKVQRYVSVSETWVFPGGKFWDHAFISNYAVEPFAWATCCNIIQGVKCNSYFYTTQDGATHLLDFRTSGMTQTSLYAIKPEVPCSRAEFASMIARLCKTYRVSHNVGRTDTQFLSGHCDCIADSDFSFYWMPDAEMEEPVL